MKRIEEELRIIRQQMEEDFLLHSERISAQQQSVERVERALEAVTENFGKVEASLSKVWEAVGTTRDSVVQLQRDFQHFSHTARAQNETWAIDRKRNLRILDVIQSGLLTGGVETEARLEKIEQRLQRLEENQSGAA